MARRVARMDQTESDVWLRLVHVLEVLPATLDAQLQRDAGMTHFDFLVLSVLRVAPEQTQRMKHLAAATNATPSRLSHVVARLEAKGLIERIPSQDDRRATDARLTDQGRRAVVHALPGHLRLVRSLVLDPLSREQLEALVPIVDALSLRLDPSDRFGWLT